MLFEPGKTVGGSPGAGVTVADGVRIRPLLLLGINTGSGTTVELGVGVGEAWATTGSLPDRSVEGNSMAVPTFELGNTVS